VPAGLPAGSGDTWAAMALEASKAETAAALTARLKNVIIDFLW
jgi:hypothetical protein